MNWVDEQIAKALLRWPHADSNRRFDAWQTHAAEESLASLSHMSISLLFLHDHKAISFAEISRRVRLPVPAVQTLYHNAFSSFLARLQQSCGVETAPKGGPQMQRRTKNAREGEQDKNRGEKTTKTVHCPRCGATVVVPPGRGYKFFVCLPCGARVRIIKNADGLQSTGIHRVKGCGTGDQEVPLDRRDCHRLLGVSAKTPLRDIEQAYFAKIRVVDTNVQPPVNPYGPRVTAGLRRRLTFAWEQIQASHPEQHK